MKAGWKPGHSESHGILEPWLSHPQPAPWSSSQRRQSLHSVTVTPGTEKYQLKGQVSPFFKAPKVECGRKKNKSVSTTVNEICLCKKGSRSTGSLQAPPDLCDNPVPTLSCLAVFSSGHRFLHTKPSLESPEGAHPRRRLIYTRNGAMMKTPQTRDALKVQH